MTKGHYEVWQDWQILYILVVIVCKAKKLLDFLNTGWRGPGLDRSHLVQIDTNSTVFNYMTEILHTVFTKLTLTSLGMELFAT